MNDVHKSPADLAVEFAENSAKIARETMGRDHQTAILLRAHAFTVRVMRDQLAVARSNLVRLGAHRYVTEVIDILIGKA